MAPEEFPQFLNVLSNFTDERSVLYKLSPAWTLIIWICITGSLITGWVAKYHIFLHIFKTKISEQVNYFKAAISPYYIY